jgi:hypothetical protein
MTLVYIKTGKPVLYGDTVKFGPPGSKRLNYRVRRFSDIGSPRVLIMRGGYGCRVNPESIGMVWKEN